MRKNKFFLVVLLALLMCSKAYADKITYSRSNIYATNKYVRIGAEYYQKKQYDLAIENYKNALKINPDNYEIIANIAVAYYRKGEYNNSIEYWKKALKITPKNFVPYMQIGNIYKIMGKNDIADTYLKKADEMQMANIRSH